MKSNTVQILTTVLSNVAVFGGLIFLILELRQNSEIALSQVRLARDNAILEEFSNIYGDNDVLSLHLKLRKGDFESITELEKERLFWFERVRYQRFEDVFFQYGRGMIDQIAFDESMSFAANRVSLWEWLEIPMGDKEMNDFVSNLLESSTFLRETWSDKFEDWIEKEI